ncbi:MAG TPA: glycosyltransferase [Candidatus Saccharimonadales bacterium]|nr:glycosyltransferase [Candidatus Saccharimonadales bacterium]
MLLKEPDGHPPGAERDDAGFDVTTELEIAHERPPMTDEAHAHAGGLAYLGAEAAEEGVAADEVVAQLADRTHEVYSLVRDSETYEVTVTSDHGLEEYERITHPDDWTVLREEAARLQGTRWTFINPTMEGGGVAMLRPPAVHLMRQLGVDARWFVMEPIKDESMGKPFKFTKFMHNISQRVAGEDERITEEGKALHWHWADTENGPVLEAQEHIRDTDVFVIDDPQPAPLIERLKRANPDARFIWRNHIDTNQELMSDPTSPQGEVASYLLDECGVREVDAVVAHPVKAFTHPGMEDKTYFAPATVDPFDNLNRHLSEEEVVEGMQFINGEIARKNAGLEAAGRYEDIQPVLNMDPDARRLTLIARFDPSKGMDVAMEMGVQTRRMLREQGVPEEELPEVVIVGNGSKDDPDGPMMFEEMLRLRREHYPDEADGITVMRLKHNYDAMNALMWRSTIVMQTSYAEGLENRIGDAERHGKPVVISDRGGMKTQVVDGESGMILDYSKQDYDVPRGARFMADLLTDPEAYARMAASTSRVAEELIAREFTTTANVTRLLRVAGRVRAGQPADKVWKMSELAAGRNAARLAA